MLSQCSSLFRSSHGQHVGMFLLNIGVYECDAVACGLVYYNKLGIRKLVLTLLVRRDKGTQIHKLNVSLSVLMIRLINLKKDNNFGSSS
jgi:hypothetical protein